MLNIFYLNYASSIFNFLICFLSCFFFFFHSFKGSGQLEFEEFVTLAAEFLAEEEMEDSAAMQEELKEAFRLYDKEGKGQLVLLFGRRE